MNPPKFATSFRLGVTHTHPVLVAEVLVPVVRGGAVYLGHLDAVGGLVVLGQLLPGRGQALAVAAPWGEELHEHQAGLGTLLKIF